MLGQLIPCGGGDAIPLVAPKLLVGRRSSCDVKLDFQNVSSHHCELEFRDGYWLISDLGSSNGIKVNGERCISSWLTPGDQVSIAKHGFTIHYVLSGDALPPKEEDTFSRSLMEKAGLESERRRIKVPQTSHSTSIRAKPALRASTEDEFIMDWLNDE